MISPDILAIANSVTDQISARIEAEPDLSFATQLVAEALMAERERHRLRYARAKGLSLSAIRDNLPADLYAIGDTVLVWVNEGDFWMLSTEEYPKAPPDTAIEGRTP